MKDRQTDRENEKGPKKYEKLKELTWKKGAREGQEHS